MTEGPGRDAADDEPVLPDQTTDDTDRGWGEDGDGRASDADDDERLIRDKPPHW